MNKVGFLLIAIAGFKIQVYMAHRHHKHQGHRNAMERSDDWITEDEGAWSPDCDIMQRWCRVDELEWTTTSMRLKEIMDDFKSEKAPEKLLECYYRVKNGDDGYLFRAKWVTSSKEYVSAIIYCPWNTQPPYRVELLEVISNKCDEACLKMNGCDYCRGESSCDCQRQSNCGLCFGDSGCSEAADKFWTFLAEYERKCPKSPSEESLIVGKRVLTRDKDCTDPRKWSVGYIQNSQYKFKRSFRIHEGLDQYEESYPYERVCLLPSANEND